MAASAVSAPSASPRGAFAPTPVTMNANGTKAGWPVALATAMTRSACSPASGNRSR